MNVLCKYASLSLAMLVGAYAFGGETPKSQWARWYLWPSSKASDKASAPTGGESIHKKQALKLLDEEDKKQAYLARLKQGLKQGAYLGGSTAMLGAGPASSLAYWVFADTPAAFAFSAARGPAYAATGAGAYLLYRWYKSNAPAMKAGARDVGMRLGTKLSQDSKAFRARTPDDVYYNLGSNYSNY